MYFDFEDYRPDISPVGQAISWREGILISIIIHMAMVIVLLLAPKLFPFDENAARARAEALERRLAEQRSARFVFVEPRVDLKAPKPPERAELSDQDRMARAPQVAPKPTNPLPLSRGNSAERVEEMRREAARGQGPAPEPSAPEQQLAQKAEPPAEANTKPPPDSLSALQLPSNRPPQSSSRAAGGSLGDALRNLQRYVQPDQFENAQGAAGAFGPAIQFDTKGVEFGPWIRRFVAQVKRNWLIPMAAMSMSGHVVITFHVHKQGYITDLTVVGPCPIDAFNTAAYGALVASNPTAPLPTEYPSDRAFFTVTFFYNEEPQ